MTHQGLYNNRDSNEIVSANRKGVQDDPWDLAVDLKKSTLKPHSAPCPIGLGNKALTDYRCRGTGLVFNKMKLMMDKFLAPILFMLTMLVTANVNAQTGEKQTLDSKQQAIVRIAAVTARGDLGKLQDELNAGLDADVTVN
ncbi:hypothetical protein [Algoriphagus terrigena]|uniref:hypothetical protein n=1 Tax=Algoriphagus terrigena TaxID=344884 RepID=UPI001FE1CB53|nr:hypothetical protein [Algoriphagus terrigena]